jgi:hypothetical protein
MTSLFDSLGRAEKASIHTGSCEPEIAYPYLIPSVGRIALLPFPLLAFTIAAAFFTG